MKKTRFNSETLEIKTHYGELHNALIQPEKRVWMTRYFWRRWGPILGNNRAAVVIALREHCLWNPQTDELRDECEIHQDDLAREAHISARTVRRIFADLRDDDTNPLHFFIKDIELQYQPSDTGQVRRKISRFTVRMDEPLTEEDETFMVQLREMSEDEREQAIKVWRQRVY